MTGYSNKKKLEEYIARHGKPDSLTEYLILEDFSEAEIEKGIAPFIEEWEEAIYWIEREDGAEHDWNLWKRSCLYDVLRHASDEQIEPHRKRIEAADDKFRSITYEVGVPFGSLLDKKEAINKQTHWWLFRIPKHGQVWRDCP